MILNAITRRVSMLAIAGLLPAMLVAAEPEKSIELEKEGVDLVRQVEEIARDVRSHAGRLNQFIRQPQISKATHVYHLDQIRNRVNENLKPAMERLTELRPELPDWKQKNIEMLFETAKSLADDATDAILAKREGRTTPPAMNAEYKALIERVYLHSDNLVKASDAAGAYAAARLKAHSAGIAVAKK